MRSSPDPNRALVPDAIEPWRERQSGRIADALLVEFLVAWAVAVRVFLDIDQ